MEPNIQSWLVKELEKAETTPFGHSQSKLIPRSQYPECSNQEDLAGAVGQIQGSQRGRDGLGLDNKGK